MDSDYQTLKDCLGKGKRKNEPPRTGGAGTTLKKKEEARPDPKNSAFAQSEGAHPKGGSHNDGALNLITSK